MSLRQIDVSGEDRRAGPTDPRPELIWVRIDALRINDAYQRPIERRGLGNIRRIAANFSWSRFGALDVNDLGGGIYEVIDGQHRTHAAAICGIEEVPALVKTLSPPQAAAAFVAINGAVTALTPIQVYRAAIEAGEPWALQCEAVVARAGCRLMTYNANAASKKPGEVYCISAVRGLVQTGHAPALVAVLGGLMAREATRDIHWFRDQPIKALTRAAHAAGITRGEAMAAFLADHDLWKIEDAVARLMIGRDPEYRGKSKTTLLEASIRTYMRAWTRSEVAA